MKSATAMWFGPPERPLLGWVHLPADGQAKGAVVLCPPIGRERSSAYFTLRRLAEAVTAEGFCAVRFDYDGTGDSAGNEDDPNRVNAWINSIDQAVRLARATGAPSVSLVGLRMGGLLAAVAAGRLGGIETLVLWDSSSSGRAFVKEQRAMQLLRFGSVSGRDGVELPGLVLSVETVEDLRNLRAGGSGDAEKPGDSASDKAVVVTPGSGPEKPVAPRRALVLARPGTVAGVDLAEAIGVPSVERVDAMEQSALFDVDPRLLRLPDATVTHIAEWLSSASEGPVVPVSRPAGASGLADDAVVAHVDGVPVTERVRSLGPHGLFAIETSAAIGATSSRSEGPVMLLLTTANEPHTGPNRLWVRLARQWAARGLTSVRFDLSGLGDSPVRPGQAEHVVRAPEGLDDVLDVASAVSPDDPSDVVLVGLCSGAYQALESALTLSPRGVCAVNPVIHFAPPEAAYGPVDPRRRICRPTTSMVRVYRRLPMRDLGRRGRSVAWRLANRLARHSAPAAWMSELVASGVDILCIGGEDETRPLLEGAGRALPRLLDSGRLRIDVIPGLDHALLEAAHREEVVRSVLDHVADRFGGPPSPAAGEAPGTLKAV